jgi:rhamnose transport system ATP-binding protein
VTVAGSGSAERTGEIAAPGTPAAPLVAGAAGATSRLRVAGISKRFDAVTALDDVSFTVAPGSIHALVGENGAGKSTLVKIVTGLEQADSGKIEVDGTSVTFHSPIEARAAGVTAVYQDPKLFPHLDVAENLYMGIFPRTRTGMVDRRALYEGATRQLREVGSAIEPHTLAAGLSLADLLLVEIARAVTRNARLLILDEPTAALTPGETDRLFRLIRRLRDGGASILFISHRLEEISGLADTVTVLRDGHHVATLPIAEASQAKLVRLMVGRDVPPSDARAPRRDRERLRVERLSRAGVFEDVSFSLWSGEIVCLAGLVGAGRSEIAETIFGIEPPTSGHVFLDDREFVPRDPDGVLRLGIAYVPEDRDAEGLITSESIRDNITLPILSRLARLGIRRPRAERAVAQDFTKRLSIKARSVEQVVSALSGGNRQKVVLAKWLATDPAVLILDEPTHGIDVGTKAEVHRIVRDLADRGLAVMVISSDLPEVLALADRVLVIANGRLSAEFSRAEASQEAIMLAATPRSPDPSPAAAAVG